MPIYDYRCRNGHEFEVFQKMSDDPLSRCHECGSPVERLFHPVAVHFKGSGFYTTDYARSRAGSDGSRPEKQDSEKKDSEKKDAGEEKAKAGSKDE